MLQKILLVDDSCELLDLLEPAPGSELDIVTATSAAEGLEACRSQGPFSVVLSEFDMPDMKGGELLDLIRAEWPDTVAVMLSGAVTFEDAVEGLHSGRLFRFIERPCRREELQEAVRCALEEHSAKQRRRHEAQADEGQAQLHARLDEQTRILVSLHRFTSQLGGASSLEQIARSTAEAVATLCPGRGVAVELESESRSWLVERGGAPGPRPHREPLWTREGRVGQLTVSSADALGRPLSPMHLAALRSIASSSSVAALEQIRRAERDAAQEATILALARLAEHRDNETGKHLERVSRLCRLIAEGLREDLGDAIHIADDWIREVARSAPLHDIGKVGIPDSILMKPGPLTADEWVIMKTHTVIGADTLRSVIEQSSPQPFLQIGLEMTWGHHEKWDGSGYPRGLAREQIPLSARILALADVYDALTSVRPYKQAWSHEQALARIRADRGTHFDPRLVDAFLARAERVDQICSRLADGPEDLLRLRRRLA